MSWYRVSTAAVRESSLYSLYMLWVPDRESYRIQIPKFLTLRGFFSRSYIPTYVNPCVPFPHSPYKLPSLDCDQAYLVERHDLTGALLDLPQLLQEVPETGLSDNLVGGEEAHAVELWGGFRLRWEAAANDLVLMKAT